VKKTIIGAFVAASLVIGGAAYLASANTVHHSDYALTSDALVMIPAMNQEWLNVTNQLYLEPNGFDGTPTFLQVPETYDLNSSVNGAVQILVNKIESLYNADPNEFDASNQIYVFGYSQAAVVAGIAEQQLHDAGIPSDDLHFVLVGDSAAANTGFLNQFIPWLNSLFPESWQQSVDDFLMQMLSQFNADSVFGDVTPNNLYPTDVYTLTGDGWANWDDGLNTSGMFSQHLAYLGLTPQEIASATETTDDLTHYFTIDSANVDFFSALSNALQIGVSPFM
jgi:hypothetical protein